MLSINRHPLITVESGNICSYPQFDLRITEHHDNRQLYWCDLQYNEHSFPSSKWPETPFVDFVSTKLSTHVRKGSCVIDNFEPVGNNYTVKFFSTLGAKDVNLIASIDVNCKFCALLFKLFKNIFVF